MNCPVCSGASLVMSERQGIEIDYCPKCRGVWLDRGELDKIIERSIEGSPTSQPTSQRMSNDSRDYSNQHRPSHDYREGHYKKKKREGFLSDLFDFD
jgi:Zn-finger nucleic acid-binding protein